MSQRPNIKDDDDELIKQNEVFQNNKNKEANFRPSAKLVRVGKRKTEFTEDTSSQTGGKPTENIANTDAYEDSDQKLESNLSHSKKKKEVHVDYTILAEAVSKSKEKSLVLKPVVARDVPSLSPLLAQWKPIPSPYGFPKPPKLDFEALSKANKPSSSNPNQKKVSLYMQHMLMERSKSELKNEAKSFSNQENIEDENLVLLGNESFILDGKSGLGKAEEAINIHKENMKKLNEMTHEERLREREDLLSNLSEEQIKFLASLRQKRQKEFERRAKEIDQSMDVDEGASSCQKEMFMDTKMEDKTNTNENFKSTLEEEGEVRKEEKEEEDILLSDLPIKPEEAKKWCHMDKLELDKLKWMTNVSKPKPQEGKKEYFARFNFQGDLLSYNTDISWREGLHHHGEEPERAGYSLDELFMFVRSRVIQQRHLGLKTLGNIVRNANEGLYDSGFEVPIIQLLVDAGLVILLRFAIDEKTPLIYKEALRALYYLVISEPDEKCLSIVEPWTPSGVQPGFSSFTHSREKDREELDEEEKELKDAEVLKLDVIRALVRMDVHVRLRYLLESVPLSPPDVLHILGILKRIARHSLTAAVTLMRTPRLIDTIVKHFLPHNTSSLLIGSGIDQLTSLDGVPLSQALSFIKVLACRGRHIALTLVENHNLVNILMAYASLEPEPTRIPYAEVLSLSLEAFHLWSIFLSYGLLKSQQGFSTFYPLFMKYLLFYRDKVDINEKVENNYHNFEIGAHLANVLTKGLCIASTTSLLMSRMKNNEPTVRSRNGKDLVLQPPVLDWKDFDEIFKQIETCIIKWMRQLSCITEVSFSGFKMLGCFCHFYSVYLENWRDQKNFSGLEFTRKMEKLAPQILSPLQDREVLDYLVKKMQSHSALCSSLKSGNCRDPVNLGSLGSVCKDGKLIPLLQKESPFPFFLPFSRLLRSICTIFPSIDSSFLASFINNNNFKSYLKGICNSKHFLTNQWFSRIEIYSITNILLVANLISVCDDLNLYHETALTILPLVHKGDDHIIKALLLDVICNAQFLEDTRAIETQIESLSVKELKALYSPSFQKPNISIIELTKKIFCSWHSIGRNLVKNLLHSILVEKSAVTEKCIPFLINSLTLDREEEITAVDHYWCLTPLKMLLLLNDAKDANSKDKNKESSEETVVSVTNWLQMTFFLLKYRKNVVKIHTSYTGWLRHLSNVFLARNDLFLDANIGSYLQACLLAIFENEGYRYLDHSWSFEDFQPGLDWYKRMIEQFGSVSYGDSTFAFFIMMPLLRSWPSIYKITLFGDCPDVLPFIRITEEEISQFIPIQEFLSPPENDENVILKYKSAIDQLLVNEQRNQFLFKFLKHHVSEFFRKS